MDQYLSNINLPFLISVLWALPWKGYALWIAARKEQKIWFIAILLLNTLGILEILYIFIFSKGKIDLSSLNKTLTNAFSKIKLPGLGTKK